MSDSVWCRFAVGGRWSCIIPIRRVQNCPATRNISLQMGEGYVRNRPTGKRLALHCLAFSPLLELRTGGLMTMSKIPFRGKRFLFCAVALGSLMRPAAGAALADEPPGPSTVAYPGGLKPELWLLGGQSNMAGYGIVKQASQPDPHIRFFASTKTWVMGQDPASSLFYPHGNPQLMPDPTKATVRGTGPALFFARHLRKYWIGRSASSAWPRAVPCRKSGTRTSATKGINSATAKWSSGSS